jgi:xanthine dehydrogenase molybdopterin-binding subunit B
MQAQTMLLCHRLTSPALLTVLCRHQDAPNPAGILSSKASGEPALLLSVGVLSAVQAAITAAVADLTDMCTPVPPPAGEGWGACMSAGASY